MICPGSSTTMAQLGCSELTPPSQRFPTRMFRDAETGEWRPYYTYKRKKKTVAVDVNGGADANGHANGAAGGVDKKEDKDEYEFVEDPDSAEGAIYPLKGTFLMRSSTFPFFFPEACPG